MTKYQKFVHSIYLYIDIKCFFIKGAYWKIMEM